MSNYNLCLGPNCHTIETQSRVRGSAGNKVLRTIKIKHDSNYRSHERYQMFNYFCGNNCLFDYLRLHLQSIIAIAPRREALETKIKDPVKETTTNDYGYTWTNTRIERVDNS